MSNDQLDELVEGWINGNRTDVVQKLLMTGKLSDIAHFTRRCPDPDSFILMLENRDENITHFLGRQVV